MSNRALRKLQGNDLLVVPALEAENSDDDDGDVDQPVVKSKKKKRKNKPDVANPFELLNDPEEEEEAVVQDDDSGREDTTLTTDTVTTSKKKKKRKKKKGKSPAVQEKTDIIEDDIDEIDASIREVNRLLNNGNIGEGNQMFSSGDGLSASSAADLKALLVVEHKHLNPDNELRRIFGSRVIRDEQTRRRAPARRRQRTSWLVQPRDNWPPIGKTGLTMSLLETKNGYQYFTFEHSQQYQQTQFQFYDAVESLDPNNIGNILHQQPFHIDTLIQLSEVFKMSEDLQMAAELIERSLYGMEMAFHPLFNMTTSTCRLEYRRMENRSLYLALFKHLVSVGQRGCNRTALEFCKLLLSLDPDSDPLCVLLLIDYYAIRAEEYDFLTRIYHEWEAHRNLSQLPNFAFSVPLAIFHQNEADTAKADEMLQNSLLMFPGVLVPLIDKCNVQPDESVSHPYFSTASQYSQSDALKQLVALYVGRSHSCWKPPEVMSWLERNVKLVLQRVDSKDPLVEDYKKRRESRYKGTPRNIYRHILVSEIPSATVTIPPDVASTVLSYDPLPPTDNIASYSRPDRPNRVQRDGNAWTMFLRSLLPNFDPNEPAPEEEGAAGGNQGNQLRQGVGALMDAMRDLLNNIRMEEPPVENQPQGNNDPDREPEEWD